MEIWSWPIGSETDARPVDDSQPRRKWRVAEASKDHPAGAPLITSSANIEASPPVQMLATELFQIVLAVRGHLQQPCDWKSVHVVDQHADPRDNDWPWSG